jgi:hypothetical protein
MLDFDEVILKSDQGSECKDNYIVDNISEIKIEQ